MGGNFNQRGQDQWNNNGNNGQNWQGGNNGGNGNPMQDQSFQNGQSFGQQQGTNIRKNRF